MKRRIGSHVPLLTSTARTADRGFFDPMTSRTRAPEQRERARR